MQKKHIPFSVLVGLLFCVVSNTSIVWATTPYHAEAQALQKELLTHADKLGGKKMLTALLAQTTETPTNRTLLPRLFSQKIHGSNYQAEIPLLRPLLDALPVDDTKLQSQVHQLYRNSLLHFINSHKHGIRPQLCRLVTKGPYFNK